MRNTLTFLLLLVCVLMGYAQKSVYIPTQFSTSPWDEWSYSKTYESDNFIIFWGNVVGTDPANYSDPDLAFDPAELAGYLEDSFDKFVTEVGFVPNTGNLGTYKIVVVMNDTYAGSGGPTGWAFGGSYDNVIGAMWVHPGATRDPYVLSHEFAHSLQGQNNIQTNTAGGYVGYDPAGWFWECHANYMRCVEFPTFASDDMPRWLMSRHFHTASTRHHYSTFKWLFNIQENYGGISTVNSLWHNSIANETPTETWRRINGWSQGQLCDAMYDYAKREANFDYPAQGFGADMRDQLNTFKTTAADNWWLWREHTILDQVDAATGHYAVPNYMAPQDYGMNIIPLHVDCSNNTVHIKFKGHTEVNSDAGWRWGFAEVTPAGSSIYSSVQSTSDGEASYTLTNASSELYLVVMGAPTTKHDYLWEIGWPQIYRYPYEVRIENAVPEGYQSDYRSDIQSLFAGAAHSNGGGWVASTASVASSVYVGPNAVVLGTSTLTGNVTVSDNARLQNVTASSSASFSGNCNVFGGNYSGTAQVKDGAIAYDVTLTGSAILQDVAWAWGTTYGSGVVVGGDAEIGSCSTAGYYLQTPHPNNGRSDCDGQGASFWANVDINNSYSTFTTADMSWTAIGCGSCSPTSVTGYVKINTDAWQQTTTVSLDEGDDVMIGPWPTSGGTWSWSGPNGFSAATREITLTDVSSTDAGTYTATYTNTCGSTSYGYFNVSVSSSVSNIAPLATATTSYVSSWETLAAVNDGYTPANSNDKTNGAYGNWNNPNSTQWVQYDWSSDYEISSTEVYWFDDAGGVLTPTSAYVEYYNGSSWVFLANVPLVTDAFNVVSFSPVTTSSLRVSMLNSTQSTGILEWRVMGQPASSSRQITIESAPSSIKVFPNPVSGDFKIEASDFDAEEEISIQIFDLSGKSVYMSKSAEKSISLNSEVLNLKSEIYILKLSGKELSYSTKLIVQD